MMRTRHRFIHLAACVAAVIVFDMRSLTTASALALRTPSRDRKRTSNARVTSLSTLLLALPVSTGIDRTREVERTKVWASAADDKVVYNPL